jgi:NAD(P)-dependent dehydrogenase (short-subunit alcohol dehydrogenase family)
VTQHRFDGRVAIVTGAGRGIGRAYARLLAELGASVVVNDLGGSMEGDGADAQPASDVASEIVGSGGTAIADTSDIATTEGAQTLVRAAIERFGRIDVLVNNAGIMRWAGMRDIDVDQLQQHLAVHVVGSFNTALAAWPHMIEQSYGRIVMTTSTGMLGLHNNISYAAAKGGIVGLSRSLSVAGSRYGIKVNLIAPAATTRMSPDASGGPQLPADDVAPMVAYLAHEDCPVTGEIYTAGGGRFARLFIASTAGYVHPGPGPTVEDVAAHWDAINDESGYFVPADLMAWSAAFLSHLDS